MERYKLVGWAKPYTKFYFVKDGDDWTCKLGFERRQRTNLEGRRFLGWHNLEAFSSAERERSKFYEVLPESWYQWEAHHALGAPNAVVYSYLTDVHCNRSAASLLIGRVEEADYITLSLVAFLRAVLYHPIACFAHGSAMSPCAWRSALLRVPWVVVDRCSRYGMFGIFKGMDVDLVLVLLVAERAAEADWDAMPDLDWFLYPLDNGGISVLLALALLRRVYASVEQTKEGGTLMGWPEFHGDFASRGLSKAYTRKAWKQFMDADKDLTELPVMEEQDALRAEYEKVVAAKPVGAAVPAVDNDKLLDVNEGDN